MCESEVKVVHSCLTVCDTMDYKAHGILTEWVAYPVSSGYS